MRRYLPLVLSGAAALAFPAALAWVFLHPPRRRHAQTPRAGLGLDYTRARFLADDGVRLSGWLVPAAEPRGLVILSHGYTGCRDTMFPYLRFLNAANFSVLLYDFRAHGWSGGQQATLGLTEPRDLQAAIRWVETQPELSSLPLFLMGESMGASVSLLVGAQEPSVRAVVADCGFARMDGPIQKRLETLFGEPMGRALAPATQRFGERLLGTSALRIAPEEAIGKLAPRPVLIVHGTADALVTPDHAHRLYAAGGESATLWLVEGAGHTHSVQTAPDYAERVVDFLEKSITAD
ncbi:alpha/beta fold hydrolase [Armatimonas rosea]|uniref:Alpha-beta hydrolase superfamily lysophospholipase n=1 Tax=Armatimonas rosea TaxID=685828 RepID=A0A7W9SRD0_ARMRO|nr:alpha-beta hydrolase superfamily lysophospholipase [Armatimonas rosea]